MLSWLPSLPSSLADSSLFPLQGRVFSREPPARSVGDAKSLPGNGPRGMGAEAGGGPGDAWLPVGAWGQLANGATGPLVCGTITEVERSSWGVRKTLFWAAFLAASSRCLFSRSSSETVFGLAAGPGGERAFHVLVGTGPSLAFRGISFLLGWTLAAGRLG